jgi:hypothetical protein
LALDKQGAALRLNLLRALPLALIACAAAYLAVVGGPEPVTAPVEQPVPVGRIDFDALHRQASAALDSLRQSQQRQRKVAAVAEAS